MFRLIRLVVLAAIALAVAVWISNRAEAAIAPTIIQTSLTSEEFLHDH